MTRPLPILLAVLWLALPLQALAEPQENSLFIQAGCTYTCQGQKRIILQNVVCVTPEQLAAIERDRQLCFAERDSYASSAELEARKAADALQTVKDLEKALAALRDRIAEQAGTLADLRSRLWVTGFVSGVAGGLLGGATTGLLLHYGKSN